MSPIRVGVAGLGRRGMYHLERFSLRDDFLPVAVHDLHPEKARSHLAGRCRFHADWRDFLADSEIDLALIATPPATHAPLALEALEAGRHVVVEKPLALAVRESDQLLEAARRSGRTLSVVHNRRWDGDFRTAHSVCASGGLGRLEAATLILWEYSLPRDPGGWRSDPAQGGGALGEFGPHYFDQLLQLVPDVPMAVDAHFPLCRNGRDEAFTALVFFRGGTTAHIEVNLRSYAPVQTGWMLAGTSGGYRQLRRYCVTEDEEVYDVPVPPLPTEWDLYYDGLASHFREGTPPPVTADEGRQVVALIAAARRSVETGRRVAVEA